MLPAFNQGSEFINEMQFLVLFSGWFIITNPQGRFTTWNRKLHEI